MFFAFRDRPSIVAEIHLRARPGMEVTFAAEIQRFIAYVKSSAKVTPTGDILMPGEIEERTKAQRSRKTSSTRRAAKRSR